MTENIRIQDTDPWFNWSEYHDTAINWLSDSGIDGSKDLLYEVCQSFRTEFPKHRKHKRGNRESVEDGGFFSSPKCSICGNKTDFTKDEIKSPLHTAPDDPDCAEKLQNLFEDFSDQIKRIWSNESYNLDTLDVIVNEISNISLIGKYSEIFRLDNRIKFFLLDYINHFIYTSNANLQGNPIGTDNIFTLFDWFFEKYDVENNLKEWKKNKKNLFNKLNDVSSNSLDLKYSILYEWIKSNDTSKDTQIPKVFKSIITNFINALNDSENPPDFKVKENELIIFKDVIDYNSVSQKSVREFSSESNTEGGKYSSNTTHWDWGVSNTQGTLSPRKSTRRSRTVINKDQVWSKSKKAIITLSTRQLYFQTIDNINAGLSEYSKMGVLTPSEDGFTFQRTKSKSTTESFSNNKLAGQIASLLLHRGKEIEDRLIEFLKG